MVGFALPVAGGVATFLATAGLTALAKKRKERSEYKRLHELVFAAIDDALAAAKAIVESGDSLASRVEAWAITTSFWIQVQTRYAEICQSPTEVHDISRFFEYAVGLVNVARDTAPGHSSLRDPLMSDFRRKMEEQASKVKSMYWPPGYESPIYPHHPNPPRKFA